MQKKKLDIAHMHIADGGRGAEFDRLKFVFERLKSYNNRAAYRFALYSWREPAPYTQPQPKRNRYSLRVWCVNSVASLNSRSRQPETMDIGDFVKLLRQVGVSKMPFMCRYPSL